MSHIIVISGHYGAGKTNVAVNLSINAAKEDRCVYLADLDIVNPYFRATDARDLLQSNRVIPLIPTLANTNVDIPSIPMGLMSALTDDNATVIIDVGGDDGAVVLGQYSELIRSNGYEMYYVVNMFRPMTSTPQDALEIMREIEQLSHLKCTGIINNSSIGNETTESDFLNSIEYGNKCAEIAGVPLLYHSTIKKFTASEGIPIFYMTQATKQLF